MNQEALSALKVEDGSVQDTFLPKYSSRCGDYTYNYEVTLQNNNNNDIHGNFTYPGSIGFISGNFDVGTMTLSGTWMEEDHIVGYREGTLTWKFSNDFKTWEGEYENDGMIMEWNGYADSENSGNLFTLDVLFQPMNQLLSRFYSVFKGAKMIAKDIMFVEDLKTHIYQNYPDITPHTVNIYSEKQQCLEDHTSLSRIQVNKILLDIRLSNIMVNVSFSDSIQDVCVLFLDIISPGSLLKEKIYHYLGDDSYKPIFQDIYVFSGGRYYLLDDNTAVSSYSTGNEYISVTVKTSTKEHSTIDVILKDISRIKFDTPLNIHKKFEVEYPVDCTYTELKYKICAMFETIPYEYVHLYASEPNSNNVSSYIELNDNRKVDLDTIYIWIIAYYSQNLSHATILFDDGKSTLFPWGKNTELESDSLYTSLVYNDLNFMLSYSPKNGKFVLRFLTPDFNWIIAQEGVLSVGGLQLVSDNNSSFIIYAADYITHGKLTENYVINIEKKFSHEFGKDWNVSILSDTALFFVSKTSNEMMILEGNNTTQLFNINSTEIDNTKGWNVCSAFSSHCQEIPKFVLYNTISGDKYMAEIDINEKIITLQFIEGIPGKDIYCRSLYTDIYDMIIVQDNDENEIHWIESDKIIEKFSGRAKDIIPISITIDSISILSWHFDPFSKHHYIVSSSGTNILKVGTEIVWTTGTQILNADYSYFWNFSITNSKGIFGILDNDNLEYYNELGEDWRDIQDEGLCVYDTTRGIAYGSHIKTWEKFSVGDVLAFRYEQHTQKLYLFKNYTFSGITWDFGYVNPVACVCLPSNNGEAVLLLSREEKSYQEI
eukprot:TRINITY_DN7522_c0_g1_i3.p1 TRINITY_DN7522_c0_g1~~TRINITY_DN7522_c0_g1_i3.p1  ORF type:complete len:827 (+),score=173.48 TRINITY_DN7522_c0_g1_i3:85-2565(+)